MSKNRIGVYVGAAIAGAGGYYLYRAGGNPKAAKEQMKYDADRIRDSKPATEIEQAEKAGEKAALETKSNIDEAAKSSVTKAKDLTSEGVKKLDEEASKVRRDVEEKAAEAKGTVSGWFGGKK